MSWRLPGSWVACIAHCQKFHLFLLFSKSLEVCSNHALRTTKVLEVAMPSRTNKHKEKGKQETSISGL
jgi:hypothetical protein